MQDIVSAVDTPELGARFVAFTAAAGGRLMRIHELHVLEGRAEAVGHRVVKQQVAARIPARWLDPGTGETDLAFLEAPIIAALLQNGSNSACLLGRTQERTNMSGTV